MKLILGVKNVSYGDAHGKDVKTTGEVAQILEDKYHVMETFYVSREDKIIQWLAESLSNSIKDLVSGHRANTDPFYGATQKIEAEFRDFLDANEMTHLVAGLSEGELARFVGGKFTGAAKRGVSHRKKKPYAKSNPSRAAFVDTGLYQQSFSASVQTGVKSE